MSTINYYMACPRCTAESCLRFFNLNTQEELESCPDCGYYLNYSIKRDKNGKLLRKDASKGFESSNLIWEKENLTAPFGTYKTEDINGAETIHLLKTRKDYEKLIGKIECNNIQNTRKIVVSRFVDGVIKKEVIFDIANPMR